MAQITIQPGQTLSGIALQYKSSVQDLMKLNPSITDPNKIYAGNALTIPDTKAAPSQQQPTLGQVSATEFSDNLALKVPDTQVPSSINDSLRNIANQGITGAASAISQDDFFKAQQQMLLEQQKQQAAAKDEQKGITQKLAEFFGGRQKQTDILKEQMDKFGFPEGFEQIRNLATEVQTLNIKMSELETNEFREIDSIQNNPSYSVQFASREANRVAREYAIRKSGVAAEIGARTATMEALRGNIAMARGLISDVVSALQADDQMTLTGLKMFYDINQDFISGLEKKEQNLLDDIRNYWQDKVDQDRKDYEMKMDLMIRAAEAGVNLGLSAGSIKTMSLEEVSRLYSEKVSGTVSAEKAAKLARSGGANLGEWQRQQELQSSTPPEWFHMQELEKWGETKTTPFKGITERIYQAWDEYRQSIKPSIYGTLGTATGKSLSANQKTLQLAGFQNTDGRTQSHYLQAPSDWRQEWADVVASGEVNTSNLTFDQYMAIYNDWLKEKEEDKKKGVTITPEMLRQAIDLPD